MGGPGSGRKKGSISGVKGATSKTRPASVLRKEREKWLEDGQKNYRAAEAKRKIKVAEKKAKAKAKVKAPTKSTKPRAKAGTGKNYTERVYQGVALKPGQRIAYG